MGLTTTPWPFRCEVCGYHLDGTPDAVVCPECGVDVGTSRPTARLGLPWQRKRSVGSWIATLVLLLRRPRAAYGMMRMDSSSMTELMWINLVVLWYFAAIPAMLGPGHVILAMPGGGTFTVGDYGPTLLMFLAMVLPPALLWQRAYMRRWGLRQKSPIAPVVTRANAGLSSYLVMMTVALPALAWLVRRLLTPNTPIPTTGPTIDWWWSFAVHLPMLLFAIALLYAGVLDAFGSHVNRYANPMPEAPPDAT